MCHIQRKPVCILTIPHVYLDLAPLARKKIRNWLAQPPPLSEKNQKLAKKKEEKSLSEKI